jgi:lycopene beta-cyclase
VNASTTDWDIVIAGAGLAGLSLAAELAASDFAHLRILLIEPRTSYERDRTWSFWATPDALPARWQALAATRWNHWRVSHLNRSVVASCDFAYTSIRAETFYTEAIAAIEAAPHISWHKRQAVSQVVSQAHAVRITTDAGEQIQSKFLFDSRPPQATAGQGWVQHFSGWEVKSATQCFNPSCIDLMAFEPSDEGLHFIYCLPYSATQALVESTWIASHYEATDAQSKREQELRDTLARRWKCADYSIIFQEQGALLLHPCLLADEPRQARIGRAGGMLRAATGYAFCNTLQQSSAIARTLSAHLQQSKPFEHWQAPKKSVNTTDAWMDRVLFRVLEKDWRKAPSYFLDMFEHAPAAPLIRFLQGASSWQDKLAVMRALPMRPFLRAALGSAS